MTKAWLRIAEHFTALDSLAAERAGKGSVSGQLWTRPRSGGGNLETFPQARPAADFGMVSRRMPDCSAAGAGTGGRCCTRAAQGGEGLPVLTDKPAQIRERVKRDMKNLLVTSGSARPARSARDSRGQAVITQGTPPKPSSLRGGGSRWVRLYGFPKGVGGAVPGEMTFVGVLDITIKPPSSETTLSKANSPWNNLLQPNLVKDDCNKSLPHLNVCIALTHSDARARRSLRHSGKRQPDDAQLQHHHARRSQPDAHPERRQRRLLP